jgi:serine/threonine-protein kinase
MSSDDTRTSDERDTTGERGPQGRPSAPKITGDRYAIGAEIGHGGMGEVFVALDNQIGREVAIKRLRSKDPSERAMQLFMREAKIQARLEHPAIVPVHELGRDTDGRPYFAMKRLSGTTMAEVIHNKDGDYPRQRLLRAFVDVCLAVELAHTRGVIHRDLKPENIMLGDFGEVYVLDWGVAKVIGLDDFGKVDAVPAEELATIAGAVVGTRGYMAPEQALAEGIDARADVYALGCVLFEILTREPRVTASSARPSDLVASSPPELDELCQHATADDREQRIASARKLADGVQHFIDGDRDVAMRRSLAERHLVAAQSAFAERSSEDGHRVAMREAGRALALDPARDDAAALVGRIMLEPPAVAPKEVEDAYLADRRKFIENVGRYVMLGNLGFLAILPKTAIHAPMRTLALVATVVINAVHVARAMRNRTLPPLWIGMFLNAITVGLTAHLFSPFLGAPGVAAVSAMLVALHPLADRRAIVVLYVTHVAAIFGVFGAEQLGWLATTTSITPDGMALQAVGLLGSEAATLGVMVIYVVTCIGLPITIVYAVRKDDVATRRRHYMQAWQLRQLLVR